MLTLDPWTLLPVWRRPIGVVPVDEARRRQRERLADAVIQVVADLDHTRDQIARVLAVEYGDVSDEDLDGVLDELVARGELQQYGRRYARCARR